MGRIKSLLTGTAVAVIATWIGHGTGFGRAQEQPSSGKQKAPTLTAEDRKYLSDLMKQFLFDPKEAERVAVRVDFRSVWGTSEKIAIDAWLVRGKDGKPSGLFLTDGESIPIPNEKQLKKVDFRAVCKTRYAMPKKPLDDGQENEEAFLQMHFAGLGVVPDDDLAFAAWLFRLGEDGLSALALAAARKASEDPSKHVREELAWSAFAKLVHAYMVRADAEALAHGERLLRLYREEAKGYEAELIVADLKRRQKKGTFGKAPAEKLPPGFEQWEIKKQAAHLIDALEEVSVYQDGQPGGVDLAADRNVDALIRLGDRAIPALLDAFENDQRLTRSVHYWRNFSHERTVLSVREALLTAIMSILRVRVFQPASTGDSFTTRGEDAVKWHVKQLRAYWKQYGQLPFDERMMTILTDPKTTFEAKREAATNLGTIDTDRRFGTTVWTDSIRDDPERKRNPLFDKFKRPTVAEAILAAMAADLKDHDGKPSKADPHYHEYIRHGIKRKYLWAAVGVGDQRIAPVIAKWATEAKSLERRREFAEAAHWLGDSKPFRAFADEFRAGKITVSDKEELKAILRALIEVGIPEAQAALEKLADPDHPQHQAVARKILTEYGDRPWREHRFSLSILRKALDDTTLTGTTYTIGKDKRTVSLQGQVSGAGGLPEFLREPAVRRDKAEERACDDAALKLNELVVGLPPYHPLFKDADKRLTALKAAFDRYSGKYRRATWQEHIGLDLSLYSPAYVPDIKPLGRTATADDVKTGKAVFHLDGKGRLADLKLPAVAMLKRDEQKDSPTRLLIVQAEIGPDGELVFGVITKENIRFIRGIEVTSIQTFADLERQEQEKRDKKKSVKN
jgi:hypothetical protein